MFLKYEFSHQVPPKKKIEPEMNNATCHVVWMFEDLDNYVGSWNNNLKELGWAGSWKKKVNTQATLVDSWNISFSGSEERRYKFQKSWSLAYFGSKMFVCSTFVCWEYVW